MAYDERSKKRTMRYIRESRDRISINLPKGLKERYKAHAASKGVSLTSLIINLINEDIASLASKSSTREI